uniref:Uncharacterized protein n=1 Tax=Physcomitrium patens TaxID=3218 RepID=A0A2K1L1Q9_PHYPA|nr:hypothetical protein PHYPA_002754 [Physcomitrium patens]
MKCANNHTCSLESNNTIEQDKIERENASKKLKKAMIFCIFFMCVEVVGGMYANSLAILTDAAHLLSDIAGFAISLFAIWASSWESTAIQSYGFFRLEILGALVSIQFIWLVTGMLLYEAFERLYDSNKDIVNGTVMFGIAILGLFVNIAMIVLLGHENYSFNIGNHEHHHNHGHDSHENGSSNSYKNHKHDNFDESFDLHGDKDHEHDTSHKNTTATVQHGHNNLNLQGAYLHVLGDAIQSIGVIIGAAAIWYNPKWKIIDVICTILFSVLVLGTTIQMLKDVLHILMESTPHEINAQEVQYGLNELPNVVAIHELHIWALTIGKTLLTCHIQVSPNANYDEVLQNVVDYLEIKFKITHTTIQIESRI